MKRLSYILVLLMLTLSAFGQKEKRVEGQFTYHAPENVTPAQAKAFALEQARLNAIAEEFGTIVAQTNITQIETDNAQTSTKFVSLGSSDVRGEWIEDIGKPEYVIIYEGNTLIITCKVKGKAREIVVSKTDYLVKVLRNGTDDKYESDQFKSGDDLFMSFQSPVKGFLAVYLVDDDENVQCLLPYSGQQDGIYRVEANKRYVLFSEKDAPRDPVDEYVLQAEHSVEHNQIYVIFSPNQFVKAVDAASAKIADEAGIVGYPRELSFEKFHQWLAKCRRHDKSLCLTKILLTVKK